MRSTAIVDSGPLIAVANTADPDHRACLDALQTPGLHLLIPTLCVAEAAYVIHRRRGSATEALFLRGLESFDVETPQAEDWPRIADLVEQYADFPLGGTDAAVVALAERFHAETVITLDRRHFGVVKPRHCEEFRLLPKPKADPSIIFGLGSSGDSDIARNKDAMIGEAVSAEHERSLKR